MVMSVSEVQLSNALANIWKTLFGTITDLREAQW